MSSKTQDEANQPSTVLLNVNETAVIPLDAICRLCTNQSDRIIGIYSEEGVTHELAFKVNTYLPIKVTQDDTLPLQCCWNCASTVLAWHELVVGSVDADRRLRELQILTSKAIVESVQEDQTKLSATPAFEPESTAASLSVFYETTPTTSNDNQLQDKSEKMSLRVLKPEDIKDIPEIKDDTPNSKAAIVEESKSRDQNQPQGPVKKGDQKSATKSTNYCIENKELIIKEDNHGNSDSGKEENDEVYHFACQYCSFIFLKEDDILQHVKEKHPNEVDVFMRSDPLLQTLTKKERRKHTKIDQNAVNAAKIIVDGRIYYNCKICGKSLHSPYTYMWHMRIHTGERPYVCDLCGKQFRVSQGLVRHLRETHEGIKNFPCDLCGRMFATRRNVEEHRRIHTNERPYICDLCGKSFKQKASLFVHNRSHSDYFPYRCSYCSQGFRTRPPLLLHVTRHTGEKPYPCDICGRCFRIKYELKRHKLVHSDEKPFSCAECGLNFRQKRYLRNHNKTNHNRSTPEAEFEKSSDDECDAEYLIIENHAYTETPNNDSVSIYDTVGNKKAKTRKCNAKELRNRRRKADIKYKIFCDVCNKGYTRRSDLERHRKMKHLDTLNSSNEIKSEADSIKTSPKISDFPCRYCNEKFERKIELESHVKGQHGISRFRRRHSEITAEYFCDVCQKGFTRKHDMKKHRKGKHPNAISAGDSERNDKQIYLKRLKVLGPENRTYYRCDICKKVFKYAYDMMRHQTTHTKIYVFGCHICAKRFPSSSGLRRHINQHHYGVKKFSCEICGKNFAANATKEEHMNIHTNYRPFVCDICGKAFKQKASLRSHKLFHTNDFKFSCYVCEKKFRRAYELKTHTWTHTGHRPHPCHLCPSTFRLGQDLKRHLKVHDKLGECKCDECGATFSQQKYLNNHKRSHKARLKNDTNAKSESIQFDIFLE